MPEPPAGLCLLLFPWLRSCIFLVTSSNWWESLLESGLLMADDETGDDVLLTVRDILK
jgi:hypothetical protein